MFSTMFRGSVDKINVTYRIKTDAYFIIIGVARRFLIWTASKALGTVYCGFRSSMITRFSKKQSILYWSLALQVCSTAMFPCACMHSYLIGLLVRIWWQYFAFSRINVLRKRGKKTLLATVHVHLKFIAGHFVSPLTCTFHLLTVPALLFRMRLDIRNGIEETRQVTKW